MKKSMHIKLWLCLIFSFSFLSNNGYAQGGVELFALDSIADVWDDATPKPFFKIPELRAENGRLDLELYIDKNWFVFEGDSVLLRSYTYRSGNQVSEQVGPWGPTLRLGPSDILNMRIINNLDDNGDYDYLGSVALNYKKFLNQASEEPEEVPKGFIKGMEKAKIYGTGGSFPINNDDVRLTEIEYRTAENDWLMHGINTCKCTPDKIGTCKKLKYTYVVVQEYNPGIGGDALRVQEEIVHDEDNHNHPHGYNTTNMHTHGFHVSPFQDDIFRQVPPLLFSNYFYELDNHTPGTFWYHPHVHGSTALQVASGMSGAIIIEDPDLSDYPALEAATAPEHERVLLINQINYNEETRELQSFAEAEKKTGPKGTTFNGIAQPQMFIRPGEVQRWRFIQSGHDAAVAMYFPKNIEVWQISIDGIYLRKPRKIRSLHMAPGNRSDVLIRVPADIEPEIYNVLSTAMQPACEYFPDAKACNNPPVPGTAETLMQVVVVGDPMEMEMPTELPELGPELDDITRDEIVNFDNPRRTKFNILTDSTPIQFVVNGKAFESGVISEEITLGTAEQWNVSSGLSWHPYHIHVNPFQVVEYAGRKLDVPIWKDVVLVEIKKESGVSFDAVLWTRYTRYWGDFVLHCHILHHEDQGMMQRIRILQPPVEEE